MVLHRSQLMTDSPLVSVALPLFNGADTIALAIRSVLSQTYPNIELLIVDDGSTDTGLHIAAKFDDRRIKIIADGKHLGISTRLNQAIDKACGKYLARMDCDDIAFVQRFERQVNFLESHPDIDLLGTAVLVFRGDGEILGKIPPRLTHAEICARPWAGFYLPHPSWMGKLEWFRRYRYNCEANGAEDQHLLFRTYRTSRFACLPDTLLGYREDRRTLRKMFQRRFVFMRSMFHTASEMRNYELAAKLVAIQIAKASADALNLVFGMKSMRNPLIEVDEDTQQEWGRMWQLYRAG
jgi:glycosyltransferase involved in cell wall biosynthesis